MANDNLLLMLAGAAKGASDIAVPFFKARYETDLAKELYGAKQQMDSTSIQRAEELTGQQTNLPRDTNLLPNELNLMKPTTYWDPSTGAMAYSGRGNVKTMPVPQKKARKIVTSQQAQDLRNAGIDVNDKDYTIHDAPVGVEKKATENTDASWAISEIDRILPLNEESSGGYVGAGVQKLKSALDVSDTKSKNTADVINTAKGLVVKVLKSSFGGQLSDSERDYLNEIYGAMPTMSRSERSIALTNVKRMLQNKVKSSAPPGTGGRDGGDWSSDDEKRLQELESMSKRKKR